MSLLAKYLAVLGRARPLSSIAIPVNPVPASRPRVTQWGTHYAKTYATWMKLAKASLVKGPLKLAEDTPLLVIVEHAVKKPKTTKRLYPIGDVDNYAKASLDVVTKAEGWWHDDDQINFLLVSKRFVREGEAPGTTLEIYSYAE